MHARKSHLTSIFPAASLIFSTFASDRPLMLHKALRVIIWIPFTVQIPTDFIFLMSAIFCEHRWGWTKRRSPRQPTFDLMGYSQFAIQTSTKLNIRCCMAVLAIVRGHVVLCVSDQCVYSQSHVSAGGQCLGRSTPVRVREKENLILECICILLYCI